MDKEVSLRVLECYKLFVEYHMSLEEIAEKLGILNITVYNDLTKRIGMLNNDELVNNVKREENHQKIAKVLKKMVSENKNFNLIYESALTFDVTLDDLAKVLGLDSKELINKIYLVDGNLMLREKPCLTVPDIAVNNFLDFWYNVYLTKKENNKEENKRLIDSIQDKEFKKIYKQREAMFREKGKVYSKLTDLEFVSLLKYQLKWGISTMKFSEEVHIHRREYYEKVKNLPDEYQDLKERWQILGDFYKEGYKRR